MVRRAILAMLLAAMMMPLARAQATVPVWDVVSIKLHRPGDMTTSVGWADATYLAQNVSMKNLIADAADVKQWLITGVPGPLLSQRWDIEAKFTEPDMKLLNKLTKEQRRAMLMTMLQQNFGLQIHRDTKMQPIFEMTVLPDGPKFKPTPVPPTPDNGEKPQPDTRFSVNDGNIVATGTSMAILAGNLSYAAERNVIDRTGLSAEYGYSLELRWTPDGRANGNDNGTDAEPLFVEAVREQLGLKLTASKAEVPTVVVDNIHAPDVN